MSKYWVTKLVVVFFLVGLSLVGNRAWAEDSVRVFCSEGPSFPVHQAAAEFSKIHGVKVDVTDGPPPQWLDRAAKEADVVFASAGFMMSEFLATEALHIEGDTVTPLYVRPSALLVRPGNPQHIADFPDLLKPGIRIMVVSGSGQTGLWEDMAGSQGDVAVIEKFRRNVVYFAPNSTQAVRVWKERKDIDVWVTWNIWHSPMRKYAEVVPVSEKYRVYRHCSAALTKRGAGSALAKQFLAYLKSKEVLAFFTEWGWSQSGSQK